MPIIFGVSSGTSTSCYRTDQILIMVRYAVLHWKPHKFRASLGTCMVVWTESVNIEDCSKQGLGKRADATSEWPLNHKVRRHVEPDVAGPSHSTNHGRESEENFSRSFAAQRAARRPWTRYLEYNGPIQFTSSPCATKMKVARSLDREIAVLHTPYSV